MIYLASPYSHHNKEIMQERYEAAAQLVANQLLIHRVNVFSPIVYGHAMAQEYDLPTDAAAWRHMNTHMLRNAAAMWVLKIDGWDESVGVAEEIKLAQTLFIPMSYVDEFGEHVL